MPEKWARYSMTCVILSVRYSVSILRGRSTSSADVLLRHWLWCPARAESIVVNHLRIAQYELFRNGFTRFEDSSAISVQESGWFCCYCLVSMAWRGRLRSSIASSSPTTAIESPLLMSIMRRALRCSISCARRMAMYFEISCSCMRSVIRTIEGSGMLEPLGQLC
eukprot:IDg14771t1